MKFFKVWPKIIYIIPLFLLCNNTLLESTTYNVTNTTSRKIQITFQINKDSDVIKTLKKDSSCSYSTSPSNNLNGIFIKDLSSNNVLPSLQVEKTQLNNQAEKEQYIIEESQNHFIFQLKLQGGNK